MRRPRTASPVVRGAAPGCSLHPDARVSPTCSARSSTAATPTSPTACSREGFG